MLWHAASAHLDKKYAVLQIALLPAAGKSSADIVRARLLDRLPALKRLAGVAAPGGFVAPADVSEQPLETSTAEATSGLSAIDGGATRDDGPSSAQDTAEE